MFRIEMLPSFVEGDPNIEEITFPLFTQTTVEAGREALLSLTEGSAQSGAALEDLRPLPIGDELLGTDFPDLEAAGDITQNIVLSPLPKEDALSDEDLAVFSDPDFEHTGIMTAPAFPDQGAEALAGEAEMEANA